MRWNGETHEQWEYRVKNEWQTSFALFPHQMHNGEWVWLGDYQWRVKVGMNDRWFWHNRKFGDTFNDPFDKQRPSRPPPPSPIKRQPPPPPTPPPLRYVKEGIGYGEMPAPKKSVGDLLGAVAMGGTCDDGKIGTQASGEKLTPFEARNWKLIRFFMRKKPGKSKTTRQIVHGITTPETDTSDPANRPPPPKDDD